MQILKKISLSSAPFLASLVVITSLTTFIGIFWAVNEYQAYQESIENIRQVYRQQYEVRVKEELDNVLELINYRRLQNDLQVELDIRERVQSAYTMASHTFRLYEDSLPVEDVRLQIAELLRPIRWNDGRGYYFAGRVEAGIIDLFADEPAFEGLMAREFAEINGRDIVGEISAIVREKEAGLYRYDLIKPMFAGERMAKVAFVKYFAPLDWFIGAGLYSQELEERLQHDILLRIQNIRFGSDGEAFCFRLDGTIIAAADPRLVGRSVLDLVDSEGRNYGRAMLHKATEGEPRSGFVQFTLHRFFGNSGGKLEKLAFVQLYPQWDWVVSTSMSMDAMEQAIIAETETYQRINFKNVTAFIVLFAIAVAFLLFSTLFYSFKIRQGLNLFTTFFRDAADSNVKIDSGHLAFREFEDLSQLANQMVEDRIKKEMLLHRDELRLDTLLRLGMMEKYSLQEKYDFVLRRIVQITRSRQGYLALVNTTQSHITLTSYCREGLDGSMASELQGLLSPRAVGQAGLIGHAVQKKSAVMANEGAALQAGDFPYGEAVSRHLDVPIFNDGKIVLVAGVCNNKEAYDNSDIRQMTMLLEGMWLHVLKKCSEEEMARLERQVIAVSEEERSKIGRDLHDDLGSHLTGVELLSKVLQQRLAREVPERASELGNIRNLIREAIDKTRRLSQGLYPVHIMEYGLEAAIEELVSEVRSLFPANFDLSWEADGSTLGKNTSIHLHYIVREAVFNAARHGRPDNIGIYMQVQSGSYELRIVDDGKGFDSTPAATGMGFHTMKYRARAIGATLTINSSSSSGTVITIRGEGKE